jgi:hypothetical protein
VNRPQLTNSVSSNNVSFPFSGFLNVSVFSHSFIHSFQWHVQNATISCRSQELLPFLSVIYFFFHPSPPTILPSSLTSSCRLPRNVVVSNSYIILFWEFYFLSNSVHAQTNVIYLTLLALFSPNNNKTVSSNNVPGSYFIQA